MNTFTNKYPHRLFAFGCSFTKFHYSTYADHIGKHYSTYENYAQQGGGNSFIAVTCMETVKRKQISPQDRVIVQWSGCARESNYGLIDPKQSRPHWSFRNEFNNIERYTHYTKRDFMLIQSVYTYLTSLRIPFIMLSLGRMTPPYWNKECIELTELYYDVLEKLEKPMIEVMKIPLEENVSQGHFRRHPSEQEHLDYANTHLKRLINNDWPL